MTLISPMATKSVAVFECAVRGEESPGQPIRQWFTNFRIADTPGTGVSKCGTASGKCHTLKLCAKRNTSRMLGTDYGLRSAPTIATEITHFSEDRLCQAWRVPF